MCSITAFTSFFETSLDSEIASISRGVLQLRDRWPLSGAGTHDGTGNLLQVGCGQFEGGGTDPAVNLLGRAAPNNSSGNAGPGKCPCNRYGGYPGAMALRNWARRLGA
jgi:hypothetical protein